jgi:predicted nucleic acid-binding Zn ribbon protein
MEAVAIKTVLQEVFQGLEGERQQREQAIIAAWGKAVGAKAAAHTTPLRVKNQTLIVGVDSSPWLYLLSFYKQRILKKMETLSGEFQKGKLNDIQFKTLGAGVEQR